MNAPTEKPDPLVEALSNRAVDDEIQRAISRFGAEAVKASVKRITKPKRGRRPYQDDWPELREVIEADAKDWLAGGDPFATRTNHSIAKIFADRKPGQSHPSTMKRIERKLADRRRRITQIVAWEVSRDGYPHADHLRAIEGLIRADSHPVWEKVLDSAHSKIAEYESRLGHPPPIDLSMKAVEDAVSNLGLPTAFTGLYGLGSLFSGIGRSG